MNASRYKRVFLSMAAGGLVLVALLLLMNTTPPAARAEPDTLCVAPGGSGCDVGVCGTPCYTSVQAAVDAAGSKAQILVAMGRYTGVQARLQALDTVTQVVYISKTVSIQGAYTTTNWVTSYPLTQPTTLDAEGQGRVIYITGSGITVTVQGLHITGGDGGGLGGGADGNDVGGGIYSRDAIAILTRNVITGNYGCEVCSANGRGGGIYLLRAPATAIISGNLIANNVADDQSWGQGGGMMLRDSDAQVTSNTIEHNHAGDTAGYGGGMAVVGGTPTIADNEVVWNVAGQGVQGLGGGIFIWSSTPVTIERNLIQSNWAINGTGDAGLTSRGGGIYFVGDPSVSAVIRDNTIRDNIASPYAPQTGLGGGIYLGGLVTPSLVSRNTLESNIAGHNDDGDGGGIYVSHSEVTILDNDILDNSATWAGSQGEGGGMFVNGGTVVLQSNEIISNHGAFFPGFPSTAIGYGGGVALSGTTAILWNNRIAGNGGTNGDNWGIGGGIYGHSGNLQILENDITNNYATAFEMGYGGGVALSGTIATLQDNRIVGNQGTSGNDWGAGGGIYGYAGTLQMVRNTVTGNRAAQVDWGFGGGVYLDGGQPRMDSNTILDNDASPGDNSYGGGVRIVQCSGFTVTNNIVAGNRASAEGSGVAILANSQGRLAHNTMAENLNGDGVGLHVKSNSAVVLYSNIIISHTVGITNADVASSSVEAKYTLFEANTTNYGAGVSSSFEITGPAALLPDYHLSSSSGAIDQGPVLIWVTRDMDGDPRPVGTAPDVGADEYALHVHLPLVLRNY